MIPLYRCRNLEPTIDLLARYFRHVVVNSNFNLNTTVRLRADLLKEAEGVFFSKTESQVELWQARGGVLHMMLKRSWDDPTAGPHDAILFVECPRSVELLDDACQETRSLAVVCLPKNWERHEHALKKITEGKDARLVKREFDKLERVKQLVTAGKFLNRSVLDRLSVPSQPSLSCAPVLPAGVAHGIHKAHGVP